MSSSAHFLKSGFMLAVSRDTLPSIYQPPDSLSPRRGLTISPRCGRDTIPSICKSWYLPSPAGVQLLRAATRSLLAHVYYTQIRPKDQLAIATFFWKFFVNMRTRLMDSLSLLYHVNQAPYKGALLRWLTDISPQSALWHSNINPRNSAETSCTARFPLMPSSTCRTVYISSTVNPHELGYILLLKHISYRLPNLSDSCQCYFSKTIMAVLNTIEILSFNRTPAYFIERSKHKRQAICPAPKQRKNGAFLKDGYRNFARKTAYRAFQNKVWQMTDTAEY